jgi:hypothetical protein
MSIFNSDQGQCSTKIPSILAIGGEKASTVETQVRTRVKIRKRGDLPMKNP